jgi:predicted aspartyl protease
VHLARLHSGMRWTLMRWTLAAVLPCAPCLSAENQGQKVTLREGYPFVDAQINGRGPFRLLVDTGAATSMLTEQAAKKAGLLLDHRDILTTLAGEKIVPGASKNMVQVGESTETAIDIDVTELWPVRQLDSKADGVLGQNFLGRAAYLI